MRKPERTDDNENDSHDDKAAYGNYYRENEHRVKEAHDPDLGRFEPSPMSDDVADHTVGDRVVDRDQDEEQRSAARVVGVPGISAAEHEIAAIGKTVAEANPDHPPEAAAVAIRFERATGKPGGATYHYPATRLDPIAEDWEPTEAASKGQRERQQIIDDHPEAVEAFAAAVERLIRSPVAEGNRIADLIDHYRSGPQTRGECQRTRDDSYRPDDEDAIVCWECKGGGRRPAKYQADDPPGEQCSRDIDPETGVRALATWRTLDDTTTLLPTATEEYDVRGVGSKITQLQTANDRDDRAIRLAALRVGYAATLEDVESYNHGRATALLRDIGAAADIPIIGGGDDDGSEERA
jgi:hypothetical protein